MEKTRKWILTVYFLINYGLFIASTIYVCLWIFVVFGSTSSNFVALVGISAPYVLFAIVYRHVVGKYISYSDEILNTQLALNLIEDYSQKVVKSNRYKKVLHNARQYKRHRYRYPTLIINLNAFASMVKLDYFKGNFNESIAFARTINFSELKISEVYSIAYKTIQYGFCLRSLLMLNQIEKTEVLFNKLKEISVKDGKQSPEIEKILKLCQAIRDIVCLKEPNEFIDEWQPKYKLFQIEKTYFQAKNEQLKGDLEKTKVYFEAISKENLDLFFVKEARKYLEENK